ncbi:MAG: BMP family lipoprotein [Bacillota bacterium]
MKKHIIIYAAILIFLAFILAGCNSSSQNINEASDEKLQVALVITDKLGDKSFFDSAHEGILRASKELNIEYKVFECNSDKTIYGDMLLEGSKYADVVIAVGYEYYDMIKEIAKGYPDVTYIYPDQVVEGVENLTCIDYTEKEGSFLAGALAAMLTKETAIEGINEQNIIGIVGGMDIPVIRDFESGYIQGAKYIDPDIIVETVFTGNFYDPQKGKEWASILYQKNADVIFSVAGACGLGVYEAAAEYKRYAIGVDSDQRYINPDVIVASMIKGVGLSIYDCLKKISDGSFQSGKIYKYGLLEKGVDLAYGNESMKQIVTEDMLSRLNDIRKKIIDGDIQIQ